MKKYVSFLLVVAVMLTSIVPTLLFISYAETSPDVGNISIENLEFAYALRATKNQVSLEYDGVTGGYEVKMPSNSKHIFLLSDKNVTEGAYTVSFEYQISSTDQSASVAMILGAERKNNNINLKTAYKVLVCKNKDLLRFSACDGATPDMVGNNVSFDSGNKTVGVTYKSDQWNTLSVAVAVDGKISVTQNGINVYSGPGNGYIDGYIGLYTYLNGTKFRNFKLETAGGKEEEEPNSSIKLTDMDFAYGLRATKENVSTTYDSATQGYTVEMPSNGKHVFLVSNEKSNGEDYTVSVEYQIGSTDTNASVALILGASRDSQTNKIDLTTAYKMSIPKNKDSIRFSTCDGATPDMIGNNVSFDSGNKNNIGVTYILNEWNKVTVTVTKSGMVTAFVNDVEVYSTTSTGYIDGYIGLYTYLAGTQFRNFKLETSNTNDDVSDSSIKLTDMDFAYGLRATDDNVSVIYDSATQSYSLEMPSNGKHVFLVSNEKPNGEDYTVSVEYQIGSDDKSASIGLVLGAGRDDNTIDITTAYKMVILKNTDSLRFSACNGATPDMVGSNNVSFDSGNKNNVGVTYKNDDWNKVSVSVTKSGAVTAVVNGVEVYSTTATGYIDGYIGLYTYLAGTRFRNFEMSLLEDDEEPDDIHQDANDFKYAYGLRANAEQVSLDYKASEDSYVIGMPDNAKHVFLVSKHNSDKKSYSVSFEYQIGSADKNASIAVILGADRDTTLGTVDVKNAYKINISKTNDSLRFSSCDGTTPDAVGNTVSYDSGNKTNVGLTYKENEWNKLTVTVNESGIIVLNVNDVEVLRTTSVGYIDGYVGLYTYLAGTRFRNFEFKYVENEEPEKIPVSEGINLANLNLAYALRATSNDVLVEYDKTTKAYKYVVGGNGSKHYFLMSDARIEKGRAYRITLDYQMDLTDKNASIGLVIGAGKDTATNTYDLKSAYKIQLSGNTDQLRISSCDGATPDLVGENVTFDSGARKDIGVTYIKNGWNKLVIEVYDKSVECYVNGEQVFVTSSIGDIEGYVGVYSYLTGSSFRIFNIEEIEQKAEIPAGFFYDLTQKSTFSYIDARNIATNAIYDSKNKNMVVSPIIGAVGNGSTNYATFFLGSNSTTFALPNENCSCEEYPIIAMKMKLKNKNSESGVWSVITSSSQSAWEADNRVNRWVTLGYPTYKTDNDWQIVYIDTSKNKSEFLKNGAVWDILQFRMIYQNGPISSENDQFIIEWIGAFASENDIKKVDGNTRLSGNYTDGGIPIDESLPARLFYDFSKSSIVRKIWADKMGTADASTAISYDPVNKAMKVSVLPNENNNCYARFYLGQNSTYPLPAYNVSIDEYPVIALKVKLKNTSLVQSGDVLARSDGEDQTWAGLKRFSYRQTDEWQVVYIDTRFIAADQRAKLAGNNWKTISIRLINNNKYDAKANYKNDEFWVAWAGVFKTVREAREFGGEVVEESKAKFLYDFRVEGTEGLAENVADTIKEYDSEVGAMKVSIKPGTTNNPTTRFYLGQKNSIIEQGVSCEEYPIIAMRVKLNNPESVAGYWHYRSSKSMASNTGYQILSNDTSASGQAIYQKTTEWQTVILNAKDLGNCSYLKDGATWDSFSFRMLSSNTKEFSIDKDVFWVAWIAGFANEKDAYEFSGDVTDTHEYVAVVGDELTYGMKANSINAYPINLQAYLGNDFSIKSFYSFGATVRDDVKGSFRKTTAYNGSLDWEPGIVVIMLGTNDINTANWKDAAEYKKDLISLIQTYKKLESTPQIYLCTTPYIIDEIAPGSLKNARVKEIVKVQKEVAKKLELTIIDTYDFLKDKPEYYFSGVYLNDEGYPAMAKFIADRIKATYTPKIQEHIYKLDSTEAIEKFISWSEFDDSEVSFDESTSTMLVKAIDARVGEKADGVLDTNVAGFKLNVSGISTDKYPVVAVKLKLGRKTAKAGWYGFDTTANNEVRSAKRPIYEATNEWQTVIIDYSDPANNTMISDFSGNWEAVSINLGVDNLSNVGDTYNVEWIGLFSSVKEAKNYGNPKVPADTNEKDVEENNSNIAIIIVVCSVCALIVGLSTVAIILIKKRRIQK